MLEIFTNLIYTGNSFQDAFVHFRTGAGMKATSLNFSLVGNTGIATQKSETKRLLDSGGLMSLDDQDVLQFIEAAMAGRCPNQAVIGFTNSTKDETKPYWFVDPRLSPVQHYTGADKVAADNDAQLVDELHSAKLFSEAVDITLKHFMSAISRIVSIELEELDSSRTLNSNGVDSLTAVEVRN